MRFLEDSMLSESDLIYDKNVLSFFELGCTIITDGKAQVYLHPAFKNREVYRGVSKKEVVQHEAVHVKRAHFIGDKYEENLAYFFSESRFRRYFGGAVRNSTDLIIMLAVIASMVLAGWLMENPYDLLGLSAIAMGSFFLRSFITYRSLKKLMLKLNPDNLEKAFLEILEMSEGEIDRRIKDISLR